jgi:hypothetical protein
MILPRLLALGLLLIETMPLVVGADWFVEGILRRAFAHVLPEDVRNASCSSLGASTTCRAYGSSGKL